MAGNYRFEMDQKDIVRSLTTTVGSFIQDRLIDKGQRTQHKEQCAERLAAENDSPDKKKEVRYSDQAVLANLDWGIDALEEAINTSNVETKMARLDYAEKMLQVCAMLNSSQKTAGVPNFYLSAWAHLNLAYLWKLRNNVHNAVLHILEMFSVDSFFSRIDFAPDLWKSLFLPHMGSIVGWYSQERRRIVMDVIPDTSDLSFTVDFDQYFNESLILSVRPEQAEKIQKLEELYGQSLDENTRLYAKYYKECMNYDATTSRRMVPMMPIAEPPMTPVHEFSSHSVPDYVKFGPILPKSAGFSPVRKPKDNAKETFRSQITAASDDFEESPDWDQREEIHEESEYSCDDLGDDYMESQDRELAIVSNNVRTEFDYETRSVASNKSVTSTRSVSSNRSATSNRSVASNRPVASNNSNKMKDEQTISNKQIISMQSPGQYSRDNSPKRPTNSRKVSTSMLRLLSTRAIDSPLKTTSLHGSPLPYDDNSSMSSTDSDGERTDQQSATRRSVGHVQSLRQVLTKSSYDQGEDGSRSYVSSPLSTPQSRPPKDFVCPITGQIFNDPVTLETGQTYESKAIQEWMNRGNTTCPITRQPLCAASLPKTNYVLKRLISSWKEQHSNIVQELSSVETPRSNFSNIFSNDLQSDSPSHGNTEVDYKPQRFIRAPLSTSPTSVISQTAVETVINALRPYILCLCNSEDLKECEEAILTIFKIWEDSKVESGIHSYLSSATIVNGFVEILSASLNKDVLRTAIYILSKLMSDNDRVLDILKTADSDFYCLADLLKKGLAEAAVLMYMVQPSFSHLSSHNLISNLIHVISDKNENHSGFQYGIAPKDAAIALLDEIVVGGDESDRSRNAMTLISENGIRAMLNCVNRVDGRQSVVSILLCCIRTDAHCRHLIADQIELSPVLELFHGGNDNVRGICIEFLCELVQLRRRTMCNQILQIIKEEGTFSTTHTLLVYLQMSPMEQKPAIASLLLQLDLLSAPRKMSIYREEAMEALFEALQKKDFPTSQITALTALSSLSGYSRASKKPYMESWLLKLAGFDQPYDALLKEEMKTNDKEFTNPKEEEKATRTWEKRVAFVLSNHEKGMIFKTLGECFKSNSIQIAKPCLVVATWLVHALYSFPDCGIRDIARKELLDKFINALQSSKNLEDKILAALALRAFISEPGGLDEVGTHAKRIWKTLRRLKRSCTVVHDIMKALMSLSSTDASELWSCVEGPDLDVSMNGEILAMLHLGTRLISSHSDGTIKIWETGKRAPRLIQEVREHTKAVTCLYVPPSRDKLYSGSLDKTIRVWSIKQEEIHCIQVHDVKDPVMVMTANSCFACFSTQGNGVKVYNWAGTPKHVNFSKQVKCFALSGDKLYCGCSGYTIQEVDLKTQTISTFYSGAKKLLGKQSINSLEIQNGFLFAGGSSFDGVAGKVFKLSSKVVVGSLSTGLDIHQMTVNNEYIFTATKCGIIEVWLKEKVTKIAYIRLGNSGNAKIMSLASDSYGLRLFAGTSDGKLQTWSLD